MSDPQESILAIVEAATGIFNASLYHRARVRLIARTSDFLNPQPFHIEVAPYSVYTKSCLFLAAHLNQDQPVERMAALFGLPKDEFARIHRAVQASLKTTVSPFAPVIERIAPRLGIAASGIVKPQPLPQSTVPVSAQPSKEAEHRTGSSHETRIDEAFRQIVENYAASTDATKPDHSEMDDTEDNAAITSENLTESARHLAVRRIIETVVDIFNEQCDRHPHISYDDIPGERGKQSISLCRQFAVYAAKQCLPQASATLPLLGQKFGGRDHTTMLHAVRKITALIEEGDQPTLLLLGRIGERLNLIPIQQHCLMTGEKMPLKTRSELLDYGIR